MLQSTMLPHLKGYINNQWVGAKSGTTFAVHNPATNEHLADVPAMGTAETKQAIAAAKAALGQVADIATRKQWLLDIRDNLLAEREEIGRVLCLEHGKPWPEAQGEVDYAASFFDYYANNMESILAPETLPETPKDCQWSVHHRPIGVVGLITPWNFPIAMIAKKLAPALAAGCPSVIKPASLTPLTMIVLFQVLDSVDLPQGMVNLVMGSAKEIGGALMESDDVPLVTFTGSTEVGQTLMNQAAKTVKRLDLELGGNAPFIVFADADLDNAVSQLIGNKFRGSGQTCVCANRVYVQQEVYQEFADLLAEKASQLTVGDGMEEGTDLGPLVDEDGFNKVKHQLEDALAKGAKQLTGKAPEQLEALFFPATVIINASQDMLCAQEETFGPLVPLIPFSTEDEVISYANDTEFGLASYVFSADKDKCHRVAQQIHFGHCAINSGTGPAAPAPFGGMLHSGMGREGGKQGLLAYVELQTIAEA